MTLDVVMTARSFDEYRAMFGLTDSDLSRRILDCPAGASGFTCEATDRGSDVTACDVAYFADDPEGLASVALSETDRGHAYVLAHADHYAWTFFAGPDEHRLARHTAAQQFSSDIRRHPGRYVPGRLPSLPFSDASFDLVLSSHLLFSYADTLDAAFHLDTIVELMRVTSHELRIFPLVPVGSSEPYPRLAELLDELRNRNIHCRTANVDYEFQRGATQMLVCHHGPSS
ncbi:MAG: hypothetical protein ABW364_18995 [Rhodococcus fascians]